MNRASETAAPLKRLKARRLSERVAEALIERLDRGEWTPGDRLPTEQELSTTFDVSRTVVREAISRLRQAGRLETIQGSGTFVAASGAVQPADPLAIGPIRAPLDRVVQVLELRRGLEGEAASMAARRRDPDQVMLMQRAIEALRPVPASAGIPVRAVMRVPRLIALATGNPLYIAQLGRLHEFLVAQPLLPVGPDSIACPAWTADAHRQVIAEQRALIEAIAAADAARARREAIRHLLNDELRLRNAARPSPGGASTMSPAMPPPGDRGCDR
ncbi:MAG: GntR family transcriptional regulator [Burkholderiaceae bacterium]